MGSAFKADACTSGQGSAFVFAEPSWQLSPEGRLGAHVGSCYYMTAVDARELAAQLLAAADKADRHNGVSPQEPTP
jgi:hypothetical protein